MQRVAASAAALVALAATLSATVAADLGRRPPPPEAPVYAPVPYYGWTGFYVGLNGGGAWGGRSRFDFPGSPPASFDVSGWLAGGTLGFNYQLGHFALGSRATSTDPTFAGAAHVSEPLRVRPGPTGSPRRAAASGMRSIVSCPM